MATDTPATTDPNFALTPDQFAESQRLQLEGAYPTFGKTMADFQAPAEAELKPYYTSLFNQLGMMEKQATEKSFKTYDELVAKLTDQYNRRGTFFSGEAVNAETGLAQDQASNVANIAAGYDTKRTGAALEQTSAITRRAQELQQKAFEDYTTLKKGEIEKQVSQKLAEYIPGYAKSVQQQMADANSPWLEIPLEEGVDWSKITGTPATSATLPTGASFYIGDPKAVKNFDETELLRKDGKIYLNSNAYKNRWIGPESLKKYKESEIVRIGKGIFLKKGVKRR